MMDVIEEIRQSPEEGARTLEREYKAQLMAVAMDLCKDPVEAEALVFDTLGETVRNIESLTHPKALFSWMCRILVSIHSRNTRRKSTEHIVYSDTLPEPPPDDEGVNRVIQAVDGKLLHEAIDRLPPKLKETVILRYFMDMPTLQVARFLMVPVGTVSSRLHMARTILGMRLGAKLKKSTVAVFAAVLLFIGATAAMVVGVSNARGEGQAAPKTFEPCGLTTTDDASVQDRKDSDVLDARPRSAQPLCVATSRPFNLVTVRMQSDDETFQENAGLGGGGLSMPVSRSAVFPSAPARIGDVRSGAALAALDTRVHIVRLGGLGPLDTVVHDRKSGPNMNLNCTKRSFTLIFR